MFCEEVSEAAHLYLLHESSEALVQVGLAETSEQLLSKQSQICSCGRPRPSGDKHTSVIGSGRSPPMLRLPSKCGSRVSHSCARDEAFGL